VCGSFEWHRHAKGDSCFAFAYLPFALKPTAIGVEWSGLQVAPNALFERKQPIAEAVVMKCGIGCKHLPGFFDRITQEFSPGGVLFIWHFCFSSFPPFFRRGFSLEKKKKCLS
jgi:hypothetical protein